MIVVNALATSALILICFNTVLGTVDFVVQIMLCVALLHRHGHDLLLSTCSIHRNHTMVSFNLSHLLLLSSTWWHYDCNSSSSSCRILRELAGSSSFALGILDEFTIVTLSSRICTSRHEI